MRGISWGGCALSYGDPWSEPARCQRCGQDRSTHDDGYCDQLRPPKGEFDMGKNNKSAAEEIVVRIPLEVRLTDKEVKAAAKELAEALNQKARLDGEVETFKAQKKAEVAAIDAVIAKNAVLVNSEKEFRLVECQVGYDFQTAKKTFTRLDNGEIVRTETITNDERQQMMPGVTDRK